MNSSNHEHEPDRFSPCGACNDLAVEPLPLKEQAERISAMAAEWADLVAKREREETDRLGRVAFA